MDAHFLIFFSGN